MGKMLNEKCANLFEILNQWKLTKSKATVQGYLICIYICKF